MIGLTIQAARELSRSGIRVLTIAAGLIETPVPSRLGLPEEYAALMLHIAQNLYLNGEAIRLDGALRMAPR